MNKKVTSVADGMHSTCHQERKKLIQCHSRCGRIWPVRKSCDSSVVRSEQSILPNTPVFTRFTSTFMDYETGRLKRLWVLRRHGKVKCGRKHLSYHSFEAGRYRLTMPCLRIQTLRDSLTPREGGVRLIEPILWMIADYAFRDFCTIDPRHRKHICTKNIPLS